MRSSRALVTIARSLQGATLILFVAVLYLARDVFIPMSLGILVAFLLSPIVARFQRMGLPSALAVITSTGLVLAVFCGFVFAMGSSVSGFSEQLPKYRSEFKQKIGNLQAVVAGWGSTLAELSALSNSNKRNSTEDSEESLSTYRDESTDTSDKANESTESPDGIKESTGPKLEEQHDGSSPSKPIFITDTSSAGIDIKSWAGGAATVLGPIGTAGLVTVFAIFILLYRDDLRDRIVSVISKGNYVITTDAFNEASERIGKYLFAQLILNVGFGTTFAMGLMAIGFFMSPTGWFPYVAVLGTVAGLARFVPYLGPLIGASLPLVLSIILFPGFKILFAVAILILVMELISNNVVEPWLYGSSTGVSPTAVIVAAVFWGWLWGPIGLLLATPLTVCAVVMGQYVPRFRFLSTLLSEKTQIPQAVRGYQRLLTGDQFRVTEFIKAEAKERTVPELLDSTVIPTIKFVLKDAQHRDLSDEQLLQCLQTSLCETGLITQTQVEDSEYSEVERNDKDRNGERYRVDGPEDLDSIAPEATLSKLHVCAIVVRNVGELLTMEAVRNLLTPTVNFSILDRSDQPDRDAVSVAQQQPDLVIVTVITPGGLEQTRYWCSALRKAGYTGQIMVVCLGTFKNFDRLLSSFRKRGATFVVTSVTQLMQKLNRISAAATSKSRDKLAPAPVATAPHYLQSEIAVT